LKVLALKVFNFLTKAFGLQTIVINMRTKDYKFNKLSTIISIVTLIYNILVI